LRQQAGNLAKRGCRGSALPAFHRPYLPDTIFAGKGGGRGMSRIEQIIVVVLCLVFVSLLGFIIRSWTLQGTPAATAPGTAATVTPPLQNAVSPPPPTCDSSDTVATIKDLALRKFNSPEGWDIVSNRGIALDTGNPKKASYYEELSLGNLSVDSFRKRGVIGNGSSCAALIGVHAAGGSYPVNTISVEYTIEPTTDGKTIVSARFRPNS
jgi:hypothetical protein